MSLVCGVCVSLRLKGKGTGRAAGRLAVRNRSIKVSITDQVRKIAEAAGARLSEGVAPVELPMLERGSATEADGFTSQSSFDERVADLVRLLGGGRGD